MKKLSLIISLLITSALLSACATATTSAPTAIVKISPTSTPTSIPPTATIEPSPTVDPNMPEGATGKDANGDWTKVENGVTYKWTTVPELNIKEWTRVGTLELNSTPNPNGFPLFDGGWFNGGGPNVLSMQVLFADSAVYAAKLAYLNHPHMEYSSNQIQALWLSGHLINDLAKLYFHKDKVTQIPNSEFSAFVRGFAGIKNYDPSTDLPFPLTIQFKTTNGVSHNWHIGPDYTYTVYQVRWEDADPATHPGFDENIDRTNQNVHYRYGATTDSNGNLIGIVATQDISALTDTQIVTFTLIPLASVLDGDIQLAYPRPLTTNPFVDNFTMYATSDTGGVPHFVVVKK